MPLWLIAIVLFIVGLVMGNWPLWLMWLIGLYLGLVALVWVVVGIGAAFMLRRGYTFQKRWPY